MATPPDRDPTTPVDPQRPISPDRGGIGIDPEHERVSRGNERERRHRRFRSRVVARQDDDPGQESERVGPTDRRGQQPSADRGLGAAEEHRARAAAHNDRPPAMGRGDRIPDRCRDDRAAERAPRPHREIDDVGLADGLPGGVQGCRPRAIRMGIGHDDDLDFCPKAAQAVVVVPAASWIRIRQGDPVERNERDTGPVVTDRREELAVQLSKGDRRLVRPDESDSTGHAAKSSESAPRRTGAAAGFTRARRPYTARMIRAVDDR